MPATRFLRLWPLHFAVRLLVVPQCAWWTFTLVWLLDDRGWSIGAASVLGVVLVAGSAYAATGSLTIGDAPGQVLQVSGVGLGSGNASVTAHTGRDAKSLLGATTARTTTPAMMNPTHRPMPLATAMARSRVSQVAPPAALPLPTQTTGVQQPTEPVHPMDMPMSGH